MNYYKMSCGHIATALCEDHPLCAICNCKEVKNIVDYDRILEGRIAVCEYCGKKTASAWNLPWFIFRPERDMDTYYCGCAGKCNEE